MENGIDGKALGAGMQVNGSADFTWARNGLKYIMVREPGAS